MSKISKRVKTNNELVDKTKLYNVKDAIKILKDSSKAKFDETIEVAFNLNLDPTLADQQLRGSLVLPHGSGRTSKILVIAEGDAAKDAEAAGADYVGSEDLIDKIQKEKWFDFDVVVATPQMMPKIGKIGQILGPKGLMPNPKTGTVTPDVKKAVEEIKNGKITYRVDKFAILHVIIAKSSFDDNKIEENLKALYEEIMRIKPASAKGTYIQSLAITSTMGPGIKLDTKSLVE
ncbi:MAG: 50S ribosomal protein L1 [Mycoplasmatales bacterium]